MSDMPRSFGVSSAGCADTALEISRALGRFWPAGVEMPSPYCAGPLRRRSLPTLPHLLWNGLLPVPSSDWYSTRWNRDLGDLMSPDMGGFPGQGECGNLGQGVPPRGW